MLSTGVAYLLWFGWLMGLCGIHRFYAGKPLTGIIWLFTLGLLGIGQFIDLFLIPSMIAKANAQHGYGGYGNRNTNTVIVNVNNSSGRSRRDDYDDEDDRPRRKRRGPENDFDFN